MSTKTTITLIPTAIRFRNNAESSKGHADFLYDGKFPKGRFGSLFDLMLEFLNSHKGRVSFFDDESSGMQVESAVADEKNKRRLHGFVKCGKYGIESELVNIEDTSKTKTREKVDCELLPFFYLMEFDPDQSAVIVILEHFGIYGAKSALTGHLRKFIHENLPDYSVVAETIVDTEYVRKIAEKNVKALRFFWNKVPHDIADSIENGSTVIENAGMEIIIRPKEGFLDLPSWIKIGGGGRGLTIEDKESDFMKVDVKVNGKDKTIRADKLSCFNMSFDITDRAVLAENGHPTEQFMLQESEDVLTVAKKILQWDCLKTC